MTMRPDMPGAPGAAPTRSDIDALVEAAGRSRIPQQVADAFASPYDPDRPDPRPGQLWRLEWDGTVALGVLTSVTDGMVDVAPVGDDPDFADPATVVCAEPSPVGYPIGVWVGLERAVPQVVLDLPIAALRPEELDLVLDVRHRLRTGRPLPSDDALGPPLVDSADMTDPRIAYRLDLEEPLTQLAEVFVLVETVEMPVHDDAADRRGFGLSLIAADEATSKPPTPQTAGTVEQLFEGGEVPAAVREALTLSRQEYISLVRGDLPLTGGEVETLASLLQRPATEIASLLPVADPDLLVCLHELPGRRDVERKAATEGTTHAEARRAVVRDVAGARRRQRSAGRTDWRKILDDYFHNT